VSRRFVLPAALPLVLALALSLPARPAAADDAAYSEQIDQYSRVMTSLEGEDELHAATSDIGALKNWLLEARLLLRDGREAELQRLLKQMRPQVELIKTLMATAMATARAEGQEADATALDTRVTKLKREKELLEQRVALLEQQRIDRIRPAAPPAAPAPAAATPPSTDAAAPQLEVVPSGPDSADAAPASPEE